ncbi:lanthionine synthetase LanC family protein [Streptosporangium sandarakinum]|uniref:lanthionine synthetase LanC family protein n=1 Tax=Streptosporangium sandarakinum TaxID=1260955 RepID=UPI0036BC2FD0
MTDEALTRTCRAQVLACAELLLEPATVHRALPDRDAPTLSHGLAGTALLHARLAAVDPAFEAAALRHWHAAIETARTTRGQNPGICGLPGGIAASLVVGTPYLADPGPLAEATAQAVTWLAARTNDHATACRALLRTPGALRWSHYDALTGLTGTARVLLAAAATGHHHAEPALAAATGFLTELLTTRHDGRPAWWIPHTGHLPGSTGIPASGAAHTGLAHGIAGPLALLAITELTGRSSPSQRQAISAAAQWLLAWRGQDGTWPPMIDGDQLDGASAPPQHGRRHAWCYGTPGIAHALRLAATALADPALRRAADHATATMDAHPPAAWDTQGATFCHGHAGVLSALPSDHPGRDHAARTITRQFAGHHRFGWQHQDQERTDDLPGLLTGSAGVALALADYAHLPHHPITSPWDSLLLLS